ncbi:FAD binding domain-containing protein [Psychromarinibacter sp. C21-152]|uniref:FAD binding domain-containing protein n=1 Tax=Psychromarinibacter sediminicola TaxID=3033385 RepID=A0AAE3T9R4_9RHOB|nr:FAD binding domain-containing protein [Psychromarinibacter sediminicola]MDF0602078.1 FAD binding domain-containing protein [Psychromarinibacter sediminicola]
MKPVAFDYQRPASVEDAVALLQAHGRSAKLLSGGQSLGPMLNMRLVRPEVVIDLNDLLELDYVREAADVIEIGALTRHHRLATAPEILRALPLLAYAAATIGHFAIRQRGTIGGSLVHADPAAQLPLVAVTLAAEIVLRSAAGTRSIPAADFLQNVMTVDLNEDEMVVAIRFPKPSAAKAGWGMRLFSRRRGDFAIVSAAVWLRRNPDGRLADMRLGLGGVAPVPFRLHDLEDPDDEGAPGESWASDLAGQAAQRVEPEDAPGLPAVYRRELACNLLRGALTDALSLAGERHG